ncbi:delta-60 repeat domain-containing protein [Streptomyces lavendulae]|uniref:delta-60 repeat domain-containing protein n=1 Tax=Streptomyces lavendulae TaxID=1914 RepID=UPI0033D0C4AE
MPHAHPRPARPRRGPGGRAGLPAALGLVLVLLLPGTALAAPGDLDPSFGPDGRVTTVFPGYAEGHDVARQADGKLVVTGLSQDGFALARYNTDGTLDTTFSGDGMVTADFGGTEFGNAVAVQPDGKVVAAGDGGAGIALLRYNADGSPGTGFGTGGRRSVGFPGDGVGASVLALQPNGKIVIAGQTDDPNSSEANDFGVARFNTNGTVDTGFGGDGFVVTGFGDFDAARGVLVQPDGKIVAAGYTAGSAFALAR